MRQHLARRGLARTRTLLTGGAEHRQQRIAHGLVAGGLAACDVAFTRGFARLPGHARQAAHQAEQHQRACTHGHAVAAHQAREHVSRRFAAGQHRQALLPALQLVAQRAGVCVTLRRFGAQAAQHDGIEITAQRRAVGRRGQAAGGCRLLRRVQALHGALQRTALQLPGQLAAQQLVEHHAQGVHIGRGPHGLALQLLGRAVGGCEAQRHGGVQVAGVQRVGLGQLRDAEIEQAHAALLVHQHIGRLQIAVHDALRMGRGHRLHHLQEKRHAGRHGQRGRVGVETLAVDQLEHSVQPALVRATVDQARDGRVLQARQQPALGAEAAQLVGIVGVAQQLQRRHLFVAAVGALHAVDLARAAAADQALHAPGAHLFTVGQRVAGGCTFGPASAGGFGGQQFLHLGTQRLAHRLAGQPGRAFGLGLRQAFVEPALGLGPALARVRNPWRVHAPGAPVVARLGAGPATPAACACWSAW